MEITYRAKQKYGNGYHGTGIQVEYKSEELSLVEQLRDKLVPLGYKYSPSPFPKDGSFGNRCSFTKNGSHIFGLQNNEEHKAFLEWLLKRIKEN